MKEVRCEQYPLKPLWPLLKNSAEKVNLVKSLNRGKARHGAGETLMPEGQTDASLYDGVAARFKTLRDGRSQILSFPQPTVAP
jgi:CRP/FNR family transcriptional regulator